MSTKEKLIKRFMRQPTDFTWDELVRLFGIFGFTLDNKGKSSGSCTSFIKDGEVHTLHKPHPSNNLKRYAMKKVLDFLVEKGFISNNKVGNDKEQEEVL